MTRTNLPGVSCFRSLPFAAVVLAALLLSPVASAELLSKKIFLCYSPGMSCSKLEFIDFKDSIGHLSVNVKPGDYDESSIEMNVTFKNSSRCKADISGSFLRGDTAVAVVDWGLVSLEPGQETKGQRRVTSLRDMRVSEGLYLSLEAVSVHGCK